DLPDPSPKSDSAHSPHTHRGQLAPSTHTTSAVHPCDLRGRLMPPRNRSALTAAAGGTMALSSFLHGPAPSSPHGAKSSQWTSMGFSATFQHKPEAGAGGCPGPEEEAPRELRDTCWHMCSFEPRGEKSCTVACGHVSKTIAVLTPGPSPESSATGHGQVMCPFQIPALEDRCQ
ncbi:hypothetical protein E2I00_018021, partial [Balaenoptera physalus]